MKFLDILLGAAAAGSALAVPATRTEKRAAKFQFVGASQSGAEFGYTKLPGQLNKDYTWPVHSSIDVRSPIYCSLAF
jgi:endoglucanase